MFLSLAPQQVQRDWCASLLTLYANSNPSKQGAFRYEIGSRSILGPLDMINDTLRSNQPSQVRGEEFHDFCVGLSAVSCPSRLREGVLFLVG